MPKRADIERADGPPDVTMRVNHIFDLMRRDEWTAGLDKHYAEAWGVSVASVRANAAEASRRLGSMFEIESARAYVKSCMQQAISDICSVEDKATRARLLHEHADRITKWAGIGGGRSRVTVIEGGDPWSE